ncbi:MAG: response regulator transcription factor [Sphingobacteriaceae bacterium]|nr:response regulator transcription factor [Cytophagaceae bacterium]
MKLRCLLIDDEPPALEVLEAYVAAVDDLELVGTCANAVQAFGVLQHQPVDVLFLDIKMPKLLGTDFVRSLRNPPRVIFTTAYREYALDGYDLDVVDYLLKPIAFERFLRAVAKVLRPETTPASLPEREAFAPNADAFLYFRADRKMVKVLTRDILFVESLKDYVKIVTTTGKPLVVKQTISSLEAMLPTAQFLRVHRSFVVALDKVTAFTPTHLEVAGQEVPVGRLFQKEVERALKSNL